MMESGPPERRLGEAHPDLHPQRLDTERDMLAGLEDDGLTGEELAAEAAAAKQEYETELRDLLDEATAAVDAFRREIAPNLDEPPPPAAPSTVLSGSSSGGSSSVPMPAAQHAPSRALPAVSSLPLPQPAVDDLLGLFTDAPAMPTVPPHPTPVAPMLTPISCGVPAPSSSMATSAEPSSIAAPTAWPDCAMGSGTVDPFGLPRPHLGASGMPSSLVGTSTPFGASPPPPAAVDDMFCIPPSGFGADLETTSAGGLGDGDRTFSGRSEAVVSPAEPVSPLWPATTDAAQSADVDALVAFAPPLADPAWQITDGARAPSDEPGGGDGGVGGGFTSNGLIDLADLVDPTHFGDGAGSGDRMRTGAAQAHHDAHAQAHHDGMDGRDGRDGRDGSTEGMSAESLARARSLQAANAGSITCVEQMSPTARAGIEMLRKGCSSLKYGRQGKPHTVHRMRAWEPNALARPTARAPALPSALGARARVTLMGARRHSWVAPARSRRSRPLPTCC